MHSDACEMAATVIKQNLDLRPADIEIRAQIINLNLIRRKA